MKQFLVICIVLLLIHCVSKDNFVVPPHCDTCSMHHTDSSGSKDTTVKTSLPDTTPASIAIQGDSSFFQKLSSITPVYLSVVVKNKEGNIIQGVPVLFSAALHNGSLDHDTIKTNVYGTAQATWTMSPIGDTTQQVIAKVIYNNTSLFVSFQGLLTHDTLYNYYGTITMDSTDMGGGRLVNWTGPTNAPDPFTIVSDSLALSNGVPYSFELDGLVKPNFQPGEHGRVESATIVINQYPFGVQVNYQVSGFIQTEGTNGRSFANPEPCDVTMYWRIEDEGNSFRAVLLESVTSPTKGSFTNGRTGQVVITSTQMTIH